MMNEIDGWNVSGKRFNRPNLFAFGNLGRAINYLTAVIDSRVIVRLIFSLFFRIKRILFELLLSILFFSFNSFSSFAPCSTEAQLDRVGGRK